MDSISVLGYAFIMEWRAFRYNVHLFTLLLLHLPTPLGTLIMFRRIKVFVKIQLTPDMYFAKHRKNQPDHPVGLNKRKWAQRKNPDALSFKHQPDRHDEQAYRQYPHDDEPRYFGGKLGTDLAPGQRSDRKPNERPP